MRYRQKDGFAVQNGFFKPTKKTEDYHAQMNTGYFKNGLVKNSYTE